MSDLIAALPILVALGLVCSAVGFIGDYRAERRRQREKPLTEDEQAAWDELVDDYERSE